MDKEIIKETVLIFSILLVLSAVSFAAGFKYRPEIEARVFHVGDYSGNNCSDLSMEDTANCLNKELRSFYTYNTSNIGKDLSLDELKVQGGVCSHAADWYYQNINNSTKYKAKYVYLNAIGNSTAHIFVVMYSLEGYCVLDQELRVCNKYV
jgi:hypothetical protein